ncbi:nuclear transport factor 2 family protein [Pokkaliibacter sp. CJK22405]|uniref:nuclear transport factor 2 family protein n=1 Tax=Pokkaliibacter sp. CJK22405 TaxID=3384615 RepID=UPI0039849A2F
MNTYLEDRLQISDLMTGWIHRDLGQWQELAGLFHPDGVIEVTWYEGSFSGFIEGSKRMGASDLATKHLIGTPVVTFNGERAIVETNAVIIAQNKRLNLGCSVHNRFYDLAEKRDGQWKLVKRQSIYDLGTFNFPAGPQDIDAEVLQKYPFEYASLAYLLEKSGFPLGRVFATRGSELEVAMRRDALIWLNA